MAAIIQFSQNSAVTDGAFAPGARVSFFLTGTTTPVTVYTDEARTIPHPTPVVANASGQFPLIWGEDDVNLKAVVTASDGSAIDTYDPVILGNISARTAAGTSFTPISGNAATDVQAAIANNTAAQSDVLADFETLEAKVPVLLASQDMTGQTEFIIDSTNFDETLFHGIQFYFAGINGIGRLQTSSDGNTFDAGASNYSYRIFGDNPVATTSSDSALLVNGFSGWTGQLFLHTGAVSGLEVIHRCEANGLSSGQFVYSDAVFARASALAIQGVRIFGTFLGGRITAIGFPR